MVPRQLVALWHRIYQDFLMPPRLEEYRSLLEEVLRRGYHVCSIEQFWTKIKESSVNPEAKYLILRHDVDTDVSCARSMWEIERALGITASYYFRVSTLDVNLMVEIAQAGGEASYHYEEIASVAKQKGLRTREQVYQHMPEIQHLFRSNLDRLRKRTGLPMRIVASHGDFVNRQLGVPNCLLLEDDAFRQEMGIELEVYDEGFMHHVTSRHADASYPRFWRPTHPMEAVGRSAPAVYLLVHPRQWRANVPTNAIDDVKRVWEGLVYWLRVWAMTEVDSHRR